MQNHHPHSHQQHHEEPSLLARKPPRPLPVSISHSPNPNRNPNPNPDSSAPPESSTTLSSDLDSPLQFETPRGKQPPPLPAPSPRPTKNGGGNGNGNENGNSNGGAILAIEKFYSPLTSPVVTPPNDNPPPHQGRSHQIVRFKSKDEAVPPQYGGGGGGGGGERSWKVGFENGDVEINGSSRRPTKKKDVMSKIGLGIRVLEVVFCLVSFAVMATDKTQGWTGDSFDRYKEYRFCLTVNIIGFVFAGFQVIDLAYHLATGDHVIHHHLRYQFDFVMDQIMAYLLISASSSAATRVVDWQLNWGKDEFTQKATASISMAFIAFLTFAMSSLISGYSLCTSDFS